jgi:hypothetical protein
VSLFFIKVISLQKNVSLGKKGGGGAQITVLPKKNK